MAINIGAPAIDRANELGPNFTSVLLNGPAANDGELITVEIWAHVNLANAKVGTFSRDGAKLTCRSYAVLGAVTAGSKQTFPGLTIDVDAGDHIGIFFDAGSIDIAPEIGLGIYYLSGDQTETGEQTYDFLAGYIESLGGWIEEAAPGAARRSFGYIIG